MTTRRYSTAGDLGWLAIAVLAHAAVLLLPIGREAAAPSRQPALAVELTLLRPSRPDRDTQAPEPDARAPQPRSRQEPPTPPQPRSDAIPNANPDARSLVPRREPAARPNPETPERPPAPSAGSLLELARESELDGDRPVPTRRLGRPVPQESAPGLQAAPSPLGARLANAYAPASPEIVDRWLAADGSHNVVVNLPNGETVCGRGEAWDPMRPLVEHVMLFRTCAGGGKRTFSMPQGARPAYTMPE